MYLVTRNAGKVASQRSLTLRSKEAKKDGEVTIGTHHLEILLLLKGLMGFMDTKILE